ncbi:MAG: hypothetical protein ATN31_00665 [Candidatus Epulonipiscioides saccharophilum]|nr:MAG: hypothetical protein ATN31_00665 [Epulopiscium sp. AS2M-Bin001]
MNNNAIKINWANISSEEEKLFLKLLNEYTIKSDKRYQECFTDFYEKEWIHAILDKHKYPITDNFHLLGGYSTANRVVVCISPYEGPIDNPISILRIDIKTGFNKALTHRDFLGSILGLGIDRSKIGDIIVTDFGAYIFVIDEIAEYIRYNLTKISRYKQIEISIINDDELDLQPVEMTELFTVVTSLRFDVVLCSVFRISREKCNKLVKAERAKLNGITVTNNSTMVKEGDTFTLRGYGKFILANIGGLSKKNKTHILVKKF